MNKLTLSPYLLINYLESTRCLKNDFAFSIYSRTLLGLRMSYYKRYNLPEEKRKFINANREKYGLRTLEEEEHLLKHLYFLKTGKDLPENYTNKDVREIGFENRIFISLIA
jgi:hypothetical protein